jgi:hypothetical protein
MHLSSKENWATIKLAQSGISKSKAMLKSAEGRHAMDRWSTESMEKWPNAQKHQKLGHTFKFVPAVRKVMRW